MESIQTRVVPIHGLEREVHITVPSAVIEPIIEEEVRKHAKKANLKGFRQGKVPDSVIDERYGREIRQQMIREHAESYIRLAFKDLSVEPIIFPNLDLKDGDKGQNLNMVAHIAVPPKIELEMLDRLNLVLPEAEVTDEFVEQQVERFRLNYQIYKSVDRVAKDGDVVNFRYKNMGSVRSSDKEFDRTEEFAPTSWQIMKEEDESELSWSDRLCNRRLRGCKTGDLIEIEETNPDCAIKDDTPDQEHRDREVSAEHSSDTEALEDVETVEDNDSQGSQSLEGWDSFNFQFEIDNVTEPVIPTLDEVFAREDVNIEDVEQLRGNIRSVEEERIENLRLGCLAQQVFSQLAEMCPFPMRESFENQILSRFDRSGSSSQDDDNSGQLTDGETDSDDPDNVENRQSSGERSDNLKSAIAKMIGSTFVSRYAEEKELNADIQWVESQMYRHSQQLSVLGLSQDENSVRASVNYFISQDIQNQVMKSLIDTLDLERVVVTVDDLKSEEYVGELTDRIPNGGPYEWDAEVFTGFEIAEDGSYIDLVKKAAEEEAARRNRPGVIGKLKNLFRS